MSPFLTANGDPRAFVVVSSSRSGSNLLIKYIRQVTAAAAFGEIFRADYPDMNAWARLAKRLELPTEAKGLHREQLTSFWELVLSRILARKQWAGAKIFYDHRRGDPIWARLGETDHRVIHLWRDSTFDQYVSRLQAIATGEWKSAGPVSGTARTTRVDFDAADYLEFRTTRRSDIEAARTTHGASARYVEIEYSQLTDHEHMSTLLYELFGERVSLEERLERQLPRPKIEYLTNPSTAEPFVADSIRGGFAAP